MPSFDIYLEVDLQEVTNAIDQVRKEISQRYDFRGSKSEVEWDKEKIIVVADDDMKLKAMDDILRQKLAKRGIGLKSVKFGEAQKAGGNMLKRDVTLKQALTTDECKKVNKVIKGLKVKVTSQIQGDQVRVTGKKRDVLQEVIESLKSELDDLDLQFGNFRD